jgi:hypothetical protein
MLHTALAGLFSIRRVIPTTIPIQSLAGPNNFSVAFGTAFGNNGAGVGLPSTIQATLVGGSIVSMPVLWTGTYNHNVAGAYTITGTPQPIDGTNNDNNVIDTVQITVNVQVFLNIQSINPQVPVTVANGTTFANVPKPSQVTVVLSNGTSRVIDSIWPTNLNGSYNGTVAGSYNLVGELTNLPSDVQNPSTLRPALSVTVSAVSNAAWFVNNVTGNDGNTGTSKAQAFRTITKACQMATPRASGDVIIEVEGTGTPYRECPIPNSGTSASRIVIKSTATRAQISALEVIPNTGWIQDVGNVYRKTFAMPIANFQANVNGNNGILANQIFRNGQMQIQARWPKISSPEQALERSSLRHFYQMGINSITTTSLTDPGLPAFGVDQDTYIWTTGWFLSKTAKLDSRNTNTLNYGSNPLHSDAKFRKSYYVTGHRDLLTQQKEWHYRSSDQTLFFWQEGGGPPSGIIEYKRRNYVFDLTGKSYVSILGFDIIGGEINGNTNTSNNIVDNLRIKNHNHSFLQVSNNNNYTVPLQTGFKLIGSNNVIRNCEFEFCGSEGIWIGPNGIVFNNKFTNMCFEGSYAACITPWAGAGNITISNNTGFRLGRSFVDFGNDRGFHPNIRITMNNIHTFSMVTTDTGATYGWGGIRLDNLRIDHNWFANNTVAGEWRNKHNGVDWHDGIHVCVYFDQAAGGVAGAEAIVDHNIMWDGSVADGYSEIDTHDNPGGRITKWYNNVFGTTNPGREAYFTPRIVAKDIFRNNIFVMNPNFAWLAPSNGNVLNSLLPVQQGSWQPFGNNTFNNNPGFVGPVETGLGYQIASNSPARNIGVHIPGITDGFEGVAPDAGAYEFGQTPWVPGYIAVPYNG